MKFKIVQYLILKLKTNPTLHLQNSIKKKEKVGILYHKYSLGFITH